MRNKTHSYSVLSPLQGRRIFVQLVITFRHGREEDETLGLSFKKELVLDRVQIYPPEKKKDEETKLQTRLIQKLGEGAFPFSLAFPELAPNSVIICADEDEDPSNVGNISQTTNLTRCQSWLNILPRNPYPFLNSQI